MLKFVKILAIVTGLVIGSCVSPYEVNLPSNLKIMVVDASLTDIDDTQTIRISETNNFFKNIYNTPVSNLNVQIIIDGKETIGLNETRAGVYALPFMFRVQPGTTYKLRFQKQDGTIYESTEEKTTRAPAIDKIFDEFEAEGIKEGEKRLAANYVYVDFKDNPDEDNNYVWTWKLWEKQTICHTDYYDFYCDSKCWEILTNKNFNVFSDVYSNGKPVYGKLIGKIPYYSFDGALLEITQQSVSAQAYRYFKLMSEQTQTSGTLVDTPPAPLIGNIKNISNPSEPVTGIFSVTSAVRLKYWLSRTNGIGKAIPVNLLGRTPITTTLSIRYPCIDGPTRTPNMPDGWIE
ncbi:DUF4249 domain-containing protein [Emticicia sp. 17c]|uniref:DUF4249 domain-containing protein n=1 Tax=Emticicia sp. 17c TaxID=3127704 RepID=UPI00301DFB07